MSGFVANPMERAEASKVALYGVADYAWNMKAYNPESRLRRSLPLCFAGSTGSIPNVLREQL